MLEISKYRFGDVDFSVPTNLNVFGAFVSRTEAESEITKSDDVPFMNLLHHAEKTQQVDANANKQVTAPADEEMPTRNSISNGRVGNNGDMTSSHESGASKSSASQASGTEDFVMVELVSGLSNRLYVSQSICLHLYFI